LGHPKKEKSMNAFDEMIAKYGLDPELFHPQRQKTETTQPLPVVVEAPKVDTLSAPPPVEAIGQPDPSWPQPFRTEPSGKPYAEFDDDDLGDLGPPF
jgi:hypothetical protein